MGSSRPNSKCPVGQCMEEELAKVFTSAKQALEQNLAGTNLATILDRVKMAHARQHLENRTSYQNFV